MSLEIDRVIEVDEAAFLERLQAWHATADCDLNAPVVRSDQLEFRSHFSNHTPLTYSAQAGWSFAVDWLLAQGAGVDVPWGFFGDRTPLQCAAYSGVPGTQIVAKRLLDAGAQVDSYDMEGRTALHYACICDRAEFCKLLISRGADFDARDEFGDIPEALAKNRLFTGVANKTRSGKRPRPAAFIAEVRAAGGWPLYVNAPRRELLEFRRQLPLLRRGPSSSVSVPVESLFSSKKVPEDVFMHVLS